MSFFAARNQVNTSIPEIDAAMKWMKSKVQQTIYPTIDLTRYAQRKVLKDDALRKYVLDFLREADFNITNIKTNSIKKLFPEEIKEMALKSNEFTEDDKKFIKETSSYEDFNTDFEHTVENERGIETYTMSIDNGEESQGTLRTLGIEAALYTAMNKGAFLTIDEIENSLHSKLLEKILYEYLRTHSRSQLLVTTHNDGLLDLVDDLIRKDSIWFTEKNKSGVTDLYKWTDFRGINRLSSIREAYRNKRFGATMN